MKTDVAQRIRELYEQNGIITPAMVVEDAKDPSSPLHDQFNWDVQAAAHAHWLTTARKLIRGVRVEIVTRELRLATAPASPIEFVESPSKESGDQGYVRAAELRDNRQFAVVVMNREIDRIESALDRAKNVAGELGLADEVKFTLSQVIRLRKRLDDVA